jgi:hypothetical protein
MVSREAVTLVPNTFMFDSSEFRAGELVEVRSKEEILRTLDRNGRLEEMPFMPEMFRHCGHRFRVFKRAHKTCDFVNKTGIRKLPNAVHLEGLRCDGSAHGGCQAECLFFWKDAWLKRVNESVDSEPLPISESGSGHCYSSPTFEGCTEQDVSEATRVAGQEPNDPDPTYLCQATLLPQFTRPIAWWDFRQYIEDCHSGNVMSVWKLLPRLAYRLYDNIVNLGIGVGPILRWLYDRFQSLSGGVPFPAGPGKIPVGSKTPSCSMNLKPGELVRVKDQRAILETVDTYRRNRGMSFSAEMVPYCGGTYRVHSRVNQIIDEKTGKMLKLKNACLILDGVTCQARYNKKMIMCPRATYPYWREIWLERANQKPHASH